MPQHTPQAIRLAIQEHAPHLFPDFCFRGFDVDASLPHWMTVRPLASTSPGGPYIVDLASGLGWLICTFMPRHAEPQLLVTEALRA
nr:hypothetical protein OG461_19845 [Streptomyces sp. NBC_00995]